MPSQETTRLGVPESSILFATQEKRHAIRYDPVYRSFEKSAWFGSLLHENHLGLISQEFHHCARLDALGNGDLLLDAVPLEVQCRLLAELCPRHSVQDLREGHPYSGVGGLVF